MKNGHKNFWICLAQSYYMPNSGILLYNYELTNIVTDPINKDE